MADNGFEYEVISICITKRCVQQLQNIALRTGRTVENLAEAAVEDAAIRSEREWPLP